MHLPARPRARHARRRKNPLLPFALAFLAVLAVLAASVALAAKTVPARAVAMTAPAAVAVPDRPAMPGSIRAAITARARRDAAARTAALLAARTYTVRAGDSISAVALRRCDGQARQWTGIYAASRALHWTARDANRLTPGQRLYLDCTWVPSMLRYAAATTPVRRITLTRTYAAAAGQSPRSRASDESTPAAARHDRFDGGHGQCGDGDRDGMDASCAAIFGTPPSASSTASTGSGYHATASPGSYGSVSPSSYSGFQQCVIARESGGNSQVMNSSGHYGLYQFSASTWQAYGGSAATFGHATVAEQNAVFANAMAQGGQSNWSPYDGC